MKTGDVSTGRLYSKYDNGAYDLVVPAVSTNREWRDLSPFFLGPCFVKDDEFHNLENLWQFCKVYRQLGHVDDKDDLTDAWYDWYEFGKALTRAQRYPAGKGAKPEFSFYRGKRWSYVNARKIIYIPYYAHLAAQTKSFAFLQREYALGARILIQDFDCYDKQGLSWSSVIEDSHRSMGHGFVLAMMLELGPTFYHNLIV